MTGCSVGNGVLRVGITVATHVALSILEVDEE